MVIFQYNLYIFGIHLIIIIIIIIIIKTLFSVGNTISYKLLFLEAHLTKYIQTMKICKQNKARTYIQFVQIRTLFYPKPCYSEPCHKEVEVYTVFFLEHVNS